MKFNIPIQTEVAPLSGASKNLEIIDNQDRYFEEKWNIFLRDYPIYTYRHDLEIYKYRQIESVSPLANRSFLIVNKASEPMAICPLFIFKNDKGIKTAAFGEERFLPIMLTHPNFSEKQRRSIEDSALKEFLRRLEQEKIERWLIEADVMSVGTDLIEDQFPARSGALDISIHQHIVDLRVDDLGIRSQLRRRALTEINGGLKAYEFKVFDQTNYSSEVGDRHFELHRKTSGRVTRPLKSFESSYDWVRQGRAFFVEQLAKGVTVNLTLVLMSKRTAIGASTADNPEYRPTVPLMHSMMWMIMLECKKRNIDFFEVGETNFRNTIHQILTPKEENIIYFKRGFGEYSWPQKRWIWFRDKGSELAYLSDRLKTYEQCLNTDN